MLHAYSEPLGALASGFSQSVSTVMVCVLIHAFTSASDLYPAFCVVWYSGKYFELADHNA